MLLIAKIAVIVIFGITLFYIFLIMTAGKEPEKLRDLNNTPEKK